MRKKIKVEAEMVVVLIAMFLLGSSIELANCKYMGWSLKVTQEMAFQLSWLDTGLLSLVSFLDRHWEPNLKPMRSDYNVDDINEFKVIHLIYCILDAI
ncbi:hypothetical protein ACS0TY_021148 [Phlomoides rotata]